MSNRPPPLPGAAPTPWSPAQLLRLDQEWRRLRRAFAYHPTIQVVPMAGNPPTQYVVHYTVNTLAIDDSGQLVYVTTSPVHVAMPEHFPHAPPITKPLTQVFHPNMTMDWIYLNPAWHPGMTLVEVIVQVGQMLAFQAYNPATPANPSALQWIYSNPHLLPTDPNAVFEPDAGGDAISRISRFGPDSLQQLSQRIEQTAQRVSTGELTAGAPQLRATVEQIRHGLSLFTDPEIPEYLRTHAGELDATATALLRPTPEWDVIGRHIAAAKAVDSTRRSVTDILDTLKHALAASEKLSPGELPPNPLAALELLPQPEAIQPVASQLREAARSSAQAVEHLKAALAELGALPPLPDLSTVAHGLSERLRNDAEKAEKLTSAAGQAGSASLHEVAPLVQAAQYESDALERVSLWATHFDLMRRAEELVEQITSLGPAGIWAYFVKSKAGGFGPFEYEQPVDLGGLTVVVRSRGENAFEVIDNRYGLIIIRSDGGEVAMKIASPDGPMPTRIQPGPSTGQLIVQLEYLITHTRESIGKLGGSHVTHSKSWAGDCDAAFSTQEAFAEITNDYRKASHGWRALVADLIAIGKLKQRLSTSHTIERVGQLVQRVLSDIARHSETLTQANARLKQIVGKSTRDAQTDQLIIPSHLAAEYAQRLAERAKSTRRIPKLEEVLAQGVRDVQERLASPELYGVPGVPILSAMPEIPPTMVDAANLASEETLGLAIDEIERQLERTIRPPGFKPLDLPAPSAAASRPKPTPRPAFADLGDEQAAAQVHEAEALDESTESAEPEATVSGLVEGEAESHESELYETDADETEAVAESFVADETNDFVGSEDEHNTFVTSEDDDVAAFLPDTEDGEPPREKV